jgi:hypothetical protein
MRRISFGPITVEVRADGTLIAFPDGSSVPGAPHDTKAYRATAEAHGYGADTLRLCQEHELLHIALCHWLGIDSPTMALLRGADGAGLQDLNPIEEAAVLAVQRLARAAGVDLVERMADLCGNEL